LRCNSCAERAIGSIPPNHINVPLRGLCFESRTTRSDIGRMEDTRTAGKAGQITVMAGELTAVPVTVTGVTRDVKTDRET
jgi:hypothetical protein